MTEIQKHLSLLGLKMQDRVTGASGVVTTIAFDLFGCVQAILDMGLEEKTGKRKESYWFDVKRLEALDKRPVMELPDFVQGPQAEGRQGAAFKPIP